MLDLRTLLLPTDLSPESANAIGPARALAERHGAEVVLLHSCTWDWEAEEAAPLLDTLVASHHLPRARIVVSLESPVELLVRFTRETPHALMVLSTHGRRGAARLVLGSTAEAVVAQAGCPVLTVKHPVPRGLSLRRILVPTDFDAHSHDALGYACDLARVWESRIMLQHVLDEDEAARRRAAWDCLAEQGSRLGLLPEDLFVSVGDPADEIVALAERKGADLIVQGTHGRRLLLGLPLGSVASAVARRAPCPVLTMRGAPREVPLFEDVRQGAGRGEA